MAEVDSDMRRRLNPLDNSDMNAMAIPIVQTMDICYGGSQNEDYFFCVWCKCAFQKLSIWGILLLA